MGDLIQIARRIVDLIIDIIIKAPVSVWALLIGFLSASVLAHFVLVPFTLWAAWYDAGSARQNADLFFDLNKDNERLTKEIARLKVDYENVRLSKEDPRLIYGGARITYLGRQGKKCVFRLNNDQIILEGSGAEERYGDEKSYVLLLKSCDEEEAAVKISKLKT